MTTQLEQDPSFRPRGSSWGVPRIGMAALALTAVLTLHTTARAQIPAPTEPDIMKRSGLLSRYVPIKLTLPGDPKRDDWYDTRWGDPPNRRRFQNNWHNGGLYGLPWRADATQSFFPFFYGSPGQSTLTEEHRPGPKWTRLPQAFLHPFKPVCVYYDQGSYVPIYDLDPIVPGPGPTWPFNWFPPLTRDGG